MNGPCEPALLIASGKPPPFIHYRIAHDDSDDLWSWRLDPSDISYVGDDSLIAALDCVVILDFVEPFYAGALVHQVMNCKPKSIYTLNRSNDYAARFLSRTRIKPVSFDFVLRRMAKVRRQHLLDSGDTQGADRVYLTDLLEAA